MVDASTGLHYDGSFETSSAMPWREYAKALVHAKDLADRNAIRWLRLPVITVSVYKLYRSALDGLVTDLGTPDLTALPDWPKLLTALDYDVRYGKEGRAGECEKLFLAMGYSAARDGDDAPLLMRPPLFGPPLFGSGLKVVQPPSGSRGLAGMLTPGIVSGKLLANDIIIGVDGVLITRGLAQLNELLTATGAPDEDTRRSALAREHVFVVRRRGAPADPQAEAALDGLVAKALPEPPEAAADTGSCVLQ